MPKVHAKTCQCCCKLPNSFKLCSTLDQNTRTLKDESSRLSQSKIRACFADKKGFLAKCSGPRRIAEEIVVRARFLG